jgi:hypothetical protein
LAKNVCYLAQSGNRLSIGLVVAKVTYSAVRVKIGCANGQHSDPYGSSAVDERRKQIESKIRISGTYAPMQDWITIAQIGAVNAKRHRIVAVSTAQGRGQQQQWKYWISALALTHPRAFAAGARLPGNCASPGSKFGFGVSSRGKRRAGHLLPPAHVPPLCSARTPGWIKLAIRGCSDRWVRIGAWLRFHRATANTTARTDGVPSL